MPTNGRGKGRRSWGGGKKKGDKSKPKSSASKSEKKEMKFHPHVGGSSSYVPFSTVKAEMLRHAGTIYSTGMYIQEYLNTGKKSDVLGKPPVLKKSAAQDPAVKAEEDEQHKTLYKSITFLL